MKVGDLVTIKHCGAYPGWTGVIVELIERRPAWTTDMYKVLIDDSVQNFTGLQLTRQECNLSPGMV